MLAAPVAATDAAAAQPERVIREVADDMVFVRDLKIVRWEPAPAALTPAAPDARRPPAAGAAHGG